MKTVCMRGLTTWARLTRSIHFLSFLNTYVTGDIYTENEKAKRSCSTVASANRLVASVSVKPILRNDHHSQCHYLDNRLSALYWSHSTHLPDNRQSSKITIATNILTESRACM